MIISNDATDEAGISIVDAWEDRDGNLHVKQAEDNTPLLYQNKFFRDHDPKNGMSENRNWQHIASFSPLAWAVLEKTRPEVTMDAKEHMKFLRTEEGAPFRVSRETHASGEGLQIIVK